MLEKFYIRHAHILWIGQRVSLGLILVMFALSIAGWIGESQWDVVMPYLWLLWAIFYYPSIHLVIVLPIRKLLKHQTHNKDDHENTSTN